MVCTCQWLLEPPLAIAFEGQLLLVWFGIVKIAVDDLEADGFIQVSGRCVGDAGRDAHSLHVVGMGAQLGFG